MLIRNLDRGDEEVRQLKRLLARDLTDSQKFLIETELRRLSGKPVESVTPAQILDFYCSDESKWTVLHNLKLKCSDGIERIDHLVISCYFDVILLNSACFYHDLKISVDGEYKLFDGREYQPIASPADKCSRQIELLSEVFNEDIVVPKRVGVPLRPRLHAVILLSPTQNVIRPPASVLDTSHVLAANQFIHKLLRHQLNARSSVSKLGILARFCPGSTLERIARELAALHQSACIDFASEIGIDPRLCRQAVSEQPPRSLSLKSDHSRSVQRKPTISAQHPAANSCGGAS